VETYRYQEIAYLLVPIILGIEFFLLARDEKKSGASSTGIYLLEISGFLSLVLIPALFIFTIGSLEYRLFPLQTESLARFDRYGVMFLFFGAWWQVYIFGAIRIRRARLRDTQVSKSIEEKIKLRSKAWILIPFICLGYYISLLILWVSPWGLKWVSIIWFSVIGLCLLRSSLRTGERLLWSLAGITFLAENVLFIWLESIV
jgi:hypothetical protein